MGGSCLILVIMEAGGGGMLNYFHCTGSFEKSAFLPTHRFKWNSPKATLECFTHNKNKASFLLFQYFVNVCMHSHEFCMHIKIIGILMQCFQKIFFKLYSEM